jgi:hypothetical protein
MTNTRADEATGRRVARPRGAVVALAAVVVGLAVLAAGCGGGSKNGVAQIGSSNKSASDNSSANTSKSGNPAAFSACMRENGVPNFPDPDSKRRILITSGVDKNGDRTGVDNNTPQFKHAARVCKNLQPEGGRPSAARQAQMRQAMLKYAQCMRSHGVPKFPDPKAGGQLTLGTKDGVDPNSPQFKSAQTECQKLVPGSPIAGAPPSPGGAGNAP